MLTVPCCCDIKGVDHFIKTSFSVTMESFLLRVKNVAFDGLKSKYSNWTYRVKTPDHMAVHFTTDGKCPVVIYCLKMTRKEVEMGVGGMWGGVGEEFGGVKESSKCRKFH